MAQRRSGAAAIPEADPTLKVVRSQLDREIKERLEARRPSPKDGSQCRRYQPWMILSH